MKHQRSSPVPFLLFSCAQAVLPRLSRSSSTHHAGITDRSTGVGRDDPLFPSHTIASFRLLFLSKRIPFVALKPLWSLVLSMRARFLRTSCELRRVPFQVRVPVPSVFFSSMVRTFRDGVWKGRDLGHNTCEDVVGACPAGLLIP